MLCFTTSCGSKLCSPYFNHLTKAIFLLLWIASSRKRQFFIFVACTFLRVQCQFYCAALKMSLKFTLKDPPRDASWTFDPSLLTVTKVNTSLQLLMLGIPVLLEPLTTHTVAHNSYWSLSSSFLFHRNMSCWFLRVNHVSS